RRLCRAGCARPRRRGQREGADGAPPLLGAAASPAPRRLLHQLVAGRSAAAWRGCAPRRNLRPSAGTTMPVINRFAEFHDDIAAWRHDIHRHPEILYEVHRTAATVAEKLRSFGL